MDSQDKEIRLIRTFDAPRKHVFDAWAKPESISRWWGPNGFSTTTNHMSFKVGGEWVFTMHGPDGTDYPNRIVYTDIKKDELLKYDHYGHKDEEGDPPHFKVIVTFSGTGENTEILMRMLFPTKEARDVTVKFGAVQGGNQTLNRLAEFLKQENVLK